VTVTILVVDETDANRKLLSYRLAASGYNVVLASDAALAPSCFPVPDSQGPRPAASAFYPRAR
jgi:CheY-like chemotaxis protein